jgi:lipid II:glycine glycyltransferase (peptidoglycan interpeptide bridge formation enzyme)
LMLETTSRDNFAWNSLEYYSNFLNGLEKSKLILAKKDWIVIAWGIFIFDLELSIYYYWASTSDKEYRNLMAPYLVQWEAIKYSKSIKSKLYDFLWVATPWDENSSLSGVTDFKKKMTKDIREVSNSYIYINKKMKYLIMSFLRKLKR